MATKKNYDSKLFIAVKQPSNIGIEPFRQSIRLV